MIFPAFLSDPGETQLVISHNSSGLLGRNARLPCDIRPPSKANPLLIVMWFKEPSTDPIYR